MDEEDERAPLMLFGRDVTQIPCFRSSFMYGIGTGVFCGLATFMFTSRPRISSHAGVASFVSTTWIYWMYCRYEWAKRKLEAEQLQAVIEQYTERRGTPGDIAIPQETLPLVDA
ncbi:cytochrome c oxidase assembly protein COX20, mitochondrial [Athalia rosae]|uniref:cytochrome c oxidase assembly protein COX20, mitochondrial n=1 Tax=Athalia rosae TaxID=37344 RepID=UPI00203395C2|nr:cytochrome c oxidase assembly protein COX20, mitochondrial [Athalia rosae]